MKNFSLLHSRVGSLAQRLMVMFCVLMLAVTQVWGANPVASATATNGKSYVIAYWNGSKYIALPNISGNASMFSGTDVVVNSNGKVTTADAPLWTLTVNSSNNSQFYIKYSNNYLFKNGTTNATNYNIKVVTTSQHYWAFTAGTGSNAGKYSVESKKSGNGNKNNMLVYDSNKWKVKGESANYCIILLEMAPAITCATTSLTGFTYQAGGGPSTAKSFSVSGSYLSGNITISAPTNYEVSKSSGSGYGSSVTLNQSSGSVGSTTVYVRLKSGLAANTYNGSSITISSTGAESKTISLSGSVTAACTSTPSVGAASLNGSISCTTATISCSGITKGSCDISEWGFVYGTSSNPTGNKTSKGTNSDSDVANFSHTFTGLTPGETYYVRAYAIVNGTTYYGTETNFTTKTITVSANNGSYGSVAAGIGLSWTATPNSGYVFASPAYTIVKGNNTEVTKEGNTFTIISTSTENVEITINFEPKGCDEKGAESITKGTSTGYEAGPVDEFYKYSTRQILYTKSDLGLTDGKKGIIKSIYFQYGYSTAMTKKTDVDIYLANTNLTSLATNSFVPFDKFTKVYSGALNCSGDGAWNEFVFTTPFEYNGVGRLVVLIDDNSGVYDGSSYVFKYHSATGAQVYKRQDSAGDIDPSDWTPNNAINNRPNTKFCIEIKDMTISTVSFSTGLGNTAQADITEGSIGSGITLPAGPTPKCSADGWSFAGWAETEVASETTTRPTLLTAGDTYYPASNTTLYAVYVKSEAAATATTTTYSINGSWTSSNGNWTKVDGKDLDHVSSYWGLNSSSSTAVSPSSWTDIETITFSGSKSSSGAGSVAFYYGSGNSWTLLESKIFSPSLTWSPSPKVTGQLKCVFTETSGNIYISSIAVTGKVNTNTYFSNPDCCIALNSVNGSVAWSSGAATVSWDDVSGFGDTWALKYKKTSDEDIPAKWTAYSGEFASADSKRSNSTAISSLEAGTQYDFKISGTYSGSDYCAQAYAFTHSSIVPKITPDASSLTDLGYGEGNDPVAQEFTVSGVGLTGDLTVTAPTNFQVKVGEADWNSSQTITASGTLAATTVKVRAVSGLHENDNPSDDIIISGGGAASQTVAVTATIAASCANPTIDTHPASASYNLNVTATALKVAATKNGTGPALTYQWYSNTENSNTTGTIIDGAENDEYTPATSAVGTKYYYCVVKSGACEATSNVAAVTVNTPTLTVSETSRAFGDKAVGPESPYYTMTFTVEGSNLAKDAPITISGAEGMFSVDVTSIDQTSAGAVSTTTITVTYNPTAAGSHNATLTIASTGATSKTVALSGTGKWKATFMNGTNLEEHSSVLVANNAAPSKPGSNPAVCDAVSTFFVGWTQSTWTGRKTQSQVDELTAANVKIYKSGDNLPAMTDHVTYYPVFAKDGSTVTNGTAVFDASDISNLTESTQYARDWIDEESGIEIYLSEGQRYTNGTPKTWTVTNGTDNYLEVDAAAGQTIISVTVTTTKESKNNSWIYYKPRSVSSGSLGSAVANGNYAEDYSITGTIASPLYIYATSNYQIRAKQVTVNYSQTNTSYSDYITTCLNCNVAPAFGEVSNSAVTVSNATVSCAGITKGTCDIDEYGFFYKTAESGVTEDDTKIQISDAVSDDDVSSFSKAFEAGALTPNTHYYFKPYAKVNGVYILGAETDFTTKSITVVANNDNYGTVTGSNFSWTATPATGYTYAATPYTFATGETNTIVDISGNAVTIASTASVNVALTINFAPKTMTVTLNNHDATTAGQESVTGTYAAGLPSIAENLPEKTGYTFQGYYENQNGGGKKYYNADGTPNANWDKEVATTIHAYWQPISYTVTLDVTDATEGDEQTVSATYDAAMPLVTTAEVDLVAPTRTGHTFTGWWNGETQYYSYINSTIESAHTWDIANNATTLTAKWSINSYLLTWSLGGGKVKTAGTAAEVDATTPSGLVVYNSEITAPVVTRTGYTFDSWNETPVETMPDHAVTYTASWTPIQSVVTLDNNGATTAGTTSITATYDADMPTITPPTKTGYRFDGYWTEGGGKKYYNADGTSANVMKSSSAMTIVAKWTPLLSYSINGTVDNTLTKGTDIAMPTSADAPESCGDCWELVGWSTNASATSISENYYAKGAQHTFDAPTTLYAVFGKIHEESYSEYATAPSCPTYEVRWHVIDNVTTDHTTECTGITSVPEVEDEIEFRCKGDKTVFMGWSATNIGFHPINDASEIADLGLFTDVEDAPVVNADKDFYAVFAEETSPEIKGQLLYEEFDNTTTSDASSAIGTSKFSNFNGETSYAYTSAYGGIKLGTKDNRGYITSKSLNLSKSFFVTLKARKYGTDGGNVQITVGSQTQTINSSELSSEESRIFTKAFNAATTSSTVRIATTTKRAYIDDVDVYTITPAVYSDYFTECCPQKAVVVADLDDAIGTIIADKELACEGEVITLLMEENHYDFVSWNVHKTGDKSTKPDAPVATGDLGEYTFTMPTPAYPVTIEANWERKNYKVTIGSATHGSATVKEAYSQESGKWIVPYGSTVTLQATPDEGYYFSKWEFTPNLDVAKTQAELEMTMPCDFTATPVFEEISNPTLTWSTSIKYSLDVKANGSAVAQGDEIPSGTPIVVTFTPVGQHEVSTWEMLQEVDVEQYEAFTSFDRDGNVVTFNMPNKNLSIEVTPVAYYTLDLSVENGSVTVNGEAQEVASAQYRFHKDADVEIGAAPANATFKFKAWTSEGFTDDNALTTDATGAMFEVKTSNLTLHVAFEPKTPYTLTLVSGGRTQEVIPALEGDAILTLLDGKTATALTGYTFKGWSATVNGTEISSDELKLNENTTVYAVYSKNAHYEKVTSTSGITNGQYLIVYEDGELAFNGDLTTLDVENNYIDVTISNGVIKATNATVAAEFTINATSGTIKSANNLYIGKTNNDNGLTASESVLTNTMSINDDGDFVVLASGGAYLRYNAASNQKRFRYYKSSSYTSQQAIQLYKYIADGANESNPSTIVANGEEFEIDAAMTLNNLTVEAGGKVTNTNNLTVNNLTIESEAGKSGQVSNAGNVHANNVYMDVTFYKTAETLDATSANQWYMISAPFDVNLNGGFFQTDGTPMVFTVAAVPNSFDLFEYDGSKRASTGKTGWKRASGKMKAGVAYLIGFEAGQSTTIRLKADGTTMTDKDAITLNTYTSTIGTTDDENAKNSNWNGVANPNLHYISISKDAQTYDNDARSYNPSTSGSTSYVVGTAFFIHGDGNANIENTIYGDLRAPRRAAEAQPIEFCVRLQQENASWANRMYIRASEEASAHYEAGRDLETMNGTNGNNALLWSNNYGMRLAIEEAPIVDNKASYALSLYAPADGTYRIETPTENEDATLYLTKDGRVMWNLSMSACEVELTKGTTENYGLLLVRKTPGVATGNLTPTLSQGEGAKILIDEHVYILRGGQMYDLTGKAVK